MERTEITRYLASLTDEEFTQLTTEARHTEKADPRAAFKRGQELYRNNGRRTIEVEGPETTHYEIQA